MIDKEKSLFNQQKNKYYGRKFSIVGDSISTLEGYNPKGYKVFYTGQKSEKTGVVHKQDTWWDQVVRYFSGELLVNNSWSGSRVTKLQEREELFPSGCSDERTSALHLNNVNPDVIIVYLGTNDWAFGAKTGNETCILGDDDNEKFFYAYNNMLKRIISNYPQGEIWCCTLCGTYISQRPEFEFPHSHAGTHIEEYNDIIRKVVQLHSCNLIDLYAYKTPYDSIDGSHPTKDGMNTIAQMIINSITKAENQRERGKQMIKKCKSCGADVPAQARYCQTCGGADFMESNQQQNMNVYQAPVQQNKPKKKKVGVTVAIVLMALAALGSISERVLQSMGDRDGERSKVEYTKGTFDGSVYTNPWADIKLVLPEGYSDADESAYLSTENDVTECGVYLMADDTMGIIYICYEKLPAYPVYNEEKYLDVALESIESVPDITYQTADTYSSIMIGGYPYTKAECEFSNGYGDFANTFYVRKLDKYMIVISAYGIDAEANDALVSNITTVNLEN